MRRVSPSMAVALLALFVALGGSGYAAVRVNGRTIVDRSISGSKLKHNTLTGRQIDESRLGQVPSAADSDFLNGRPAGAYVLADGGTAANAKNAQTLDGLAASAFLPAGGTAVNASLLGGQPASAFLGAGATAVNAGKLDGLDSTAFAPAGKVLGAGPVRLGPGDSVTLFSSGPFTVVAQCAAGQATIVVQHADNILDPTGTGNVNLVPGGDTTLVTATFASGAAAIERTPFSALTLGAGLQGVATATATSTLCEAAAFGIAS
jgi:hypothetical protein